MHTQIFTNYHISKGNADTKRMIRTMKEELFWLREWEYERELSLELDKWGAVQAYFTQFYESLYLACVIKLLLLYWNLSSNYFVSCPIVTDNIYVSDIYLRALFQIKSNIKG